jgi:hypothetical protein
VAINWIIPMRSSSDHYIELFDICLPVVVLIMHQYQWSLSFVSEGGEGTISRT